MRQALAAGVTKAAIVRASGLNRQYLDRVLAKGGAEAPAGGDVLADVARAAEVVRAATQAEQTATRARHVAVARALDAEALSASEVATICQISRSRVYQSRDTGRALLAER